MDKLSSKFDVLRGLPSGIERRVVTTNPPAATLKPKTKKALEAMVRAIEKPAAVTKAQKVKAWREANPEAYAEQKRRNAEKQAKKRAEREQAK